MTASTTPTLEDAGSVTVAAMEAAWADVRAVCPEVPPVVVVIAGGADYKRGKVVWGRFHPGQWETAGGPRHELLVSGECLSQGPRHTLETVLHEAAHALNYARGIDDTSRRGAYHNKRFVKAAVELGLEWPEGENPHVTRGFSEVRLTDEAAERYGATLDRLDAGRRTWRTLVFGGTGGASGENTEGTDEAAGDAAEGKPKRSRNTKPKAVCGCGPSRAIWASRRVLAALTIRCDECLELYAMQEQDEG